MPYSTDDGLIATSAEIMAICLKLSYIAQSRCSQSPIKCPIKCVGENNSTLMQPLLHCLLRHAICCCSSYICASSYKCLSGRMQGSQLRAHKHELAGSKMLQNWLYKLRIRCRHHSNAAKCRYNEAHPAGKGLHSSNWCAAWILSRVQSVGRHSHHTTRSKVITTSFIFCIEDGASHQLTCSNEKPALLAGETICQNLQLSDTIKQIWGTMSRSSKQAKQRLAATVRTSSTACVPSMM